MSNNKLAAVDIGTNSFHLIVVEYTERGNFEIIDRAKEVIRLNEGNVGDIKYINDRAINRAVHTLTNFLGIAKAHGASLRALATSAVRESINKDEFLKTVYEKTGLEIEVISGIEEARLIYLGSLKAINAYHKKTLCIDIGGGSTEFIIGKEGKSEYSVSLKLGAVRLAQKFFPDYVVTKDGIEKCRKWVKGVLYPTAQELKKRGFELCIGSSGTIQASGQMILANRKEDANAGKLLNNFQFTAKELNGITNEILKKKTVKERVKIPGLEEKRADIIPAGAILLSVIFETLGIEKMTISEYALREGIIIDTLEKNKDNGIQPQLHDIRMDSVKHLAEISKFDQDHCQYVTNLALGLFDKLTDVHKLEPRYREYLEAATLLHDIGYHISHSQHHRHGYYIIRHSNLLGFNDTEIEIIANIARYHRKSHPKKRHKEFSSLNEKNQLVVKKLAAILRIADAFDRTHSKKIKDVIVIQLDDIIELNLKFEGEVPEIEIWSYERRKELFEEVFDKRLAIIF